MYAKLLDFRLLQDLDARRHGRWLSAAMYDRSGRDYERRIRADVGALLEAHPDGYTLSDDRTRLHTTAVVQPSLEEMTAELAADMREHGATLPDSTLELLLATLTVGRIEYYYGYTYSSKLWEDLHLMVCGIDWTKFEGVEMGTWTSFTDTYNEPDQTSVLESRLTCRCELGITETFGLETETVTKVFVTLPSGAIHELYKH